MSTALMNPAVSTVFVICVGTGVGLPIAGGAQIAEKHANFIVNLGDARAEDIVWLMTTTRQRAHEELGIWLEPEIQLWGFSAERCRSVGATA